jgi:PHD/YefM family antitoxin component YafN of YafNO toxin-antitoxin module
MKCFALADLAHDPSAIRHEAALAPVALTERDAPRFVLMAIEDYQRLSDHAGLRFVATPLKSADAGLEAHILPGQD